MECQAEVSARGGTTHFQLPRATAVAQKRLQPFATGYHFTPPRIQAHQLGFRVVIVGQERLISRLKFPKVRSESLA